MKHKPEGDTFGEPVEEDWHEIKRDSWIDEDRIPYYICVVCGCNVCKDEISQYMDNQDSREVICIDCDTDIEF